MLTAEQIAERLYQCVARTRDIGLVADARWSSVCDAVLAEVQATIAEETNRIVQNEAEWRLAMHEAVEIAARDAYRRGQDAYRARESRGVKPYYEQEDGWRR